MKKCILILFLFFTGTVFAETGYELWLRYTPVKDRSLADRYRAVIKQVHLPGSSEKISAIKNELNRAAEGMLGAKPSFTASANGSLLIGTPSGSSLIASLGLNEELKGLGDDGFIIRSAVKVNGKAATVIASNSETGLVYGTFRFLKSLQSQENINRLSISDKPAVKHRILNHWDNLDRTVERGYAGFSLWNWHKLPGYIDQRYIDYARANASIGINGAVVNNVNSNALSLTKDYLVKAAALANTFRPYGIKLYLSARFSAPVEIGGLKTADPLDPAVQQWWKDKAKEIYGYIPDFGGFLVKANSEGQPGPQNYGRNHAEGANLLADAVKPFGGIVMWRAFVYDNNVPDDRAKQAYNEFKPLDGKFRDNVMVQVKNGAIDFQPREPFHPLFGAMPETPLMMEFQITQEYLGFSTHLAYLATMFEETLDADTWAKGKGSTVAKVVDGSLEGHSLTGIAGVANIGSDVNWTGHPFAQSSWYSFGRLSWDPGLGSADIADEWIRLTFTNDQSFIGPVRQMMLDSRENVVSYMTPLGLHHIMGNSHHYGPGPWVAGGGRADWTSVYYHRADTAGIGFNRASTGSDAVGQYFPEVRNMFEKPETTPDNLLLWFHHLPWTYKMKSGRTLWNEMVKYYYDGAASVEKMQETWNRMEGKIDRDRFENVKQLLAIQAYEAGLWRDACVLYFQTFSKLPIPDGYTKPEHPLSYYRGLQFRFVPGIRGTN